VDLPAQRVDCKPSLLLGLEPLAHVDFCRRSRDEEGGETTEDDGQNHEHRQELGERKSCGSGEAGAASPR
jgi:hypothetical protein